tara:strand:+ start:2492 stop:2905 length:414 start_codon:yes stop_codon:yes gene_type:complete
MKTKSSIDIVQIKLAVSKELGLNLSKNTRNRSYVYGRAIYFKLCKEFSHATLFEIGKSVGREHASVIHGLNVFDMIAMYNDSIINVYTKLRDHLVKENEESLKKYNEEIYYKIKYEKLLAEHEELLEKITKVSGVVL